MEEDLRTDMEAVALKQLENKSLDENYKLIDISYLGEVELQGTVKKIYVLLEEKTYEDGEVKLIEKYYTEDLEFVAAQILGDEIGLVLDAKYMDCEELIELLMELREEGMISLSQLEQAELKKMAVELGIDEEEILNVVEVDDKKEVPEITEERLKSVDIKQEIKTSTMVTDKQNMAQILGVQDQNYSKIVIVESSEIEGNTNGTRYSIMGVDKNGDAHTIDTLEQGYGVNSTREYNTVNRDGTQIESESQKSIYKIRGNDEGEISIKNGSHGTIDVSYMRTSRTDRGSTLGVPIETSSTRYTTREVRESMNRNKNSRIDDEAEKLEKTESVDDLYVIENAELEYNEQKLNELVEDVLFLKDEYLDVYNRRDIRGKIINLLETDNREVITEEYIVSKVRSELDSNMDQRIFGGGERKI